MIDKPVAWMNKTATSWVSTFIHPETEPDEWIPLYTHQYERPHNTVLVPCDKLAEMQAEIEALKQSKFKDNNKVNFELTDEEIIKVYENMLGVASARGSAIDFARAILRKAQ